ncbi:MAG: DNA polymerase III subunits gamma and tau [Fluviibacter phosphoraccumulans EoVTN8]
MSYQVLARKWRPKSFESLVGQDAVVRALTHALDANRLHHAYLLTGTRGVGKTTIARILAKALNCEQGVSSKPCGVCSACQQIDAGRLYGNLLPIPEARIQVGKHGDILALGQRTLEILDTPGHARHHISVVDHTAKGIFSGDTFGLSYWELDVDIFPTTTPVNFEPDAMHASIELMRSFKPSGIYLTHYSQVTEVDKLADDLHRYIDALVDITNEAAMTSYLLKERSTCSWLHVAGCRSESDFCNRSGSECTGPGLLERTGREKGGKRLIAS